MKTLDLPVATTVDDVRDRLRSITDGSSHRELLCRLGGGLLEFASAIFPPDEEHVPQNVHAQTNTREPRGKGPHFDIYGTLIDPKYPWIGVFNIAGPATIRTTELPPNLTTYYASFYTGFTPEARDARRRLGTIAMRRPQIGTLSVGLLDPGMGLVLPQPIDGPHIVHEIMPLDPANPGRFAKLAVPSGEKAATDQLEKAGYVPLAPLDDFEAGEEPEWPDDMWPDDMWTIID